MTVNNKNFTERVILDSNKCHFILCRFQNATSQKTFVCIDDEKLNCSFISCLFFKINGDNYIMDFQKGNTGIQDRCCYYENSCFYNMYISNPIKIVSVNSTSVHNNQANAPFLASTDEFTNFFNNHSFMQGEINCYVLNIAPIKEDNACFFSGSSGIGNYPVIHASRNSGNVFTNFNFVNCTDSKGFFSLWHINHKRIKNSVISFKSKDSLEWICPYNYQGATLSIEGCFIIASGEIKNNLKVTLTAGTKMTASVPTHTPFYSEFPYIQCVHRVDFSSRPYSHSLKELNMFEVMIIFFLIVILK